MKRSTSTSRPQGFRRVGVTLIEIMICVLIGSIIVYAASRLLSGGLKTSAKGTAHLTLVQSSTILMSQIEDDLHRTHQIVVPAQDAVADSAQFETWETDGSGKPVRVMVSYLPNSAAGGKGFIRRRGDGEEHVFCRGMLVEAKFTHVLTNDTGRVGMVVALTTRSLPPADEEFQLNRFIFCNDHPRNGSGAGWQRQP